MSGRQGASSSRLPSASKRESHVAGQQSSSRLNSTALVETASSSLLNASSSTRRGASTTVVGKGAAAAATNSGSSSSSNSREHKERSSENAPASSASHHYLSSSSGQTASTRTTQRHNDENDTGVEERGEGLPERAGGSTKFVTEGMVGSKRTRSTAKMPPSNNVSPRATRLRRVEAAPGSPLEDRSRRGRADNSETGHGEGVDASASDPDPEEEEDGEEYPGGRETKNKLLEDLNAAASPRERASPSPAPPPRRAAVVLASTPAFLRHKGKPGSSLGAVSPAVQGQQPVADATPTPLGSSLLRGFSHLRQSLTGSRQPPLPTPPPPTASRSPAVDTNQRNDNRNESALVAAAAAMGLSPGFSPIAPSGQARGGRGRHQRREPSSSLAPRPSAVSMSFQEQALDFLRATTHVGSAQRSSGSQTAARNSGSSSSPRVASAGAVNSAGPAPLFRPPSAVAPPQPGSAARGSSSSEHEDLTMPPPGEEPPATSRNGGGSGGGGGGAPLRVSHLSANLAEVISASRVSLRSSLAAAAAAAQATRDADSRSSRSRAPLSAADNTQRYSDARASLSTLPEPDLSPILPRHRRGAAGANNATASRSQLPPLPEAGPRYRRAAPSPSGEDNGSNADGNAAVGGGGGGYGRARGGYDDTPNSDDTGGRSTVSSDYFYLASARASADAAAAGGRSGDTHRGSGGGGGGVRHRPRLTFGRVCRSLCAWLWVLLAALVVASLAWPLVAVPRLSTDPALALVRMYVNSVPELHSLYQVPAASLTQAEAGQLQLRLLSEGVERLERATAHLQPPPPHTASADEDEDDAADGGQRRRRRQHGAPDSSRSDSWWDAAPTGNTPPSSSSSSSSFANGNGKGAAQRPPMSAAARRLHYTRMIYAYMALQQTTLLYARSRDRSLWRRWVAFPAADVWHYAVRRQGLSHLARADLQEVLDRVACAVAAATQTELLPFPTVPFVEQEMRWRAQNGYRGAAGGYGDRGDDDDDDDDPNAHLFPSARRRRYRPASWGGRGGGRVSAFAARRHQIAKMKPEWSSAIYLETLLDYIRGEVQEAARQYVQ